MKAKSLLCLIFSVLTTVITGVLPSSAEERQKLINPQWKFIRPLQNIVIAPGDEVYMSTNIHPDPFDGIYKVDENGMVMPRFCKKSVKIGGLTELEASKEVLQHTDDSDVYNSKSVRINVIKANRLPNK